MKCMNDELIQSYIDGETSAEETRRIKDHLANCSECLQRMEEMSKVADFVKQRVGLLAENEIEIPEFTVPKTRKKAQYAKLKKFAYISAAACLILILVLLHQKTDEKIELSYSFKIENEYNANLPISEQDMVIQIIDADGNVTQF